MGILTVLCCWVTSSTAAETVLLKHAGDSAIFKKPFSVLLLFLFMYMGMMDTGLPHAAWA